MKKNRIILVAAAVFSFAFAEAQEAGDCNVMLSIYAEQAKARNYDEAYKHLDALVEKCPDASAAIYQYGERIYEDRLRKKKGDKDENVKGLLEMLHGQVDRFPDKVNVTKKEMEIARTMYKYDMGSQEEQFKMLKSAFQEDKKNFSDPNAMITYFKLAEERYEAQKMDLQEFFDTYDELTLQIETLLDERGELTAQLIDKEAAGTLTDEEKAQLEAQQTNIKNYGIVMKSVNGTLGQLADCDKLIPLYEAEFENKKTNEVWLSNVLKRLQSKDCTDAPLYITSVKALHELRPSGKTAYGLGNIASTQAEKFKYWDQAIELGVSKDLVSKIHYKKGLELKKQGRYGQAKGEFLKANAAKPSFGAPYLQIANMIASSANSCGSTPFEKRAVNWVAARYASKAAAVDPSIKSNAAQAAASYRGRAPQKQDIFMDKQYNSGSTIRFSCWIGESVTIP
jgi:tetratricopeptide (TPR) repeat protein